MKTKEELNALKNEYEALTAKLRELDENELAEVTGGDGYDFRSARISASGCVDSLRSTGLPKIEDDEKYVMNILEE